MKQIFYAVVVFAVVSAGFSISRLMKGVPVDYSTDPGSPAFNEQFKYGSIGSDDGGLPYKIWRVLPVVFPEYLPDKGAGGPNYASFGLIYEKDHTQPIGMSIRKGLVDTVGLNCAVCHTGSWRASADGERHAVTAMPGQQFNLGDYFNFLFQCVDDPRFTEEKLVPAIKAQDGLGMIDRLILGTAIKKTREVLQGQEKKLAFLNENGRSPMGPGRVDTFNPYKTLYFGADMKDDASIGVVDFPGIWEQQIKKDLFMHWDGNNNSIDERNISASLGAGAKPDTVDLKRVNRIRDWLMPLPPPKFPFPIDQALAQRGQAVYAANCAQCHDPGGKSFGAVDPLTSVKTDSERSAAFNGSFKNDKGQTVRLVDAMNTLGEGYPWKFSHFRLTDGYVNRPLEGIWARAPYLHNGSVPTLRALLEANRPKEPFYRGYDVYNPKDVGFVSNVEQAGGRPMLKYDTTLRGNSNAGHEGPAYGTELSPEDKNALIEYLKTK